MPGPVSDLSSDTAFFDLFNGMQDPALILDGTRGEIRAANRAAADLLGYPQDVLVGMTAADIHPHEQPRLREFLAEVLHRGAWLRDDLSCRTRDGDGQNQEHDQQVDNIDRPEKATIVVDDIHWIILLTEGILLKPSRVSVSRDCGANYDPAPAIVVSRT